MTASVAFLALGTRGDVQPLAVLASEMQRRQPELQCHLVTHADHRAWLGAFLEAGVQLHALAAAPARLWFPSPSASSSGRNRGHGTQTGAQAQELPPDESFNDPHMRRAVLSACEAALCRSVSLREPLQGRGSAQSEHPQADRPPFKRARQQREGLGQSLEDSGRLFAAPLEAPPLAAATSGVDKVVGRRPDIRFFKLSPIRDLPSGLRASEASYPSPETSAQRLEATTATGAGPGAVRTLSPGLRAATAAPPGLIVFNLFSLEGLHIAEALGVPCAAVSPCFVPAAPPPGFERRFRASQPALYRRLKVASPQGGSLSWAEVEHWLWPAFTDRWAAWRQECLGLPPVYCSSDEAAMQLPPPPPLLYTLSEVVTPRPGYWPPSITMAGILAPPLHQGGDPEQESSHEGLVQRLRGLRRPLVCIDLGSTSCMGLLPAPARFVTVLLGALRAAQCCGLLLTGGYTPLAEAAAAECAPELVWTEGSVPHGELLPLCDAVMHAGGAGTTSAALLAGVPQLLCPLHFDQFCWAERVEWLGVGCTLADPQALVGTGNSTSSLHWESADTDMAVQQLAGVLGRVLDPALLARARQLGSTLRAESEGALVAAAEKLLHLLRSRQRGRRSAALHGASQRTEASDQKAAVPHHHHYDGEIPTGYDISTQSAALDAAAEARQTEAAAAERVPRMVTAAEVTARGAETGLGPQPQQSAALGLQDATSMDVQKVDCLSLGEAEILEAEILEAGTLETETLEAVTLPNGMRLLCSSPAEARFIYDEIFVQRCYSRHGIRVRAGDTVLDAGANVGLFTLFLLRGGAFGRPERIIAVEPMPGNLAALRANITEHGFQENVTVVPCALGETAGISRFTLYPRMPGNSTRHPAEKQMLQGSCMPASWFAGASEVQCPVRTVSSIIDELGIARVHLLKVDVEGSELEVLQGIEGRHWARVQQVVVEVHAIHSRVETVYTLLVAEGFTVTRVQAIPDCNWLLHAVRKP